MSKSLLVPIRIEGLFLTENSYVCSPLADFEKLPWNDGSQDYNYEAPFLGDSIVNMPFSDRNCLLMKGLHLHFILPHFLGQPVPNESGLANAGELPAAPNFWVIVKKGINNAVLSTSYVQSDYVYDDNADFSYAQIAKKEKVQPYSSIIPYGKTSNDKAGARPYAFMGKSGSTKFDYSITNSFKKIAGKPLTVIGYGDINFSSFYPNCKGVFGFHDDAADLSSGTSYEIYGFVYNGTSVNDGDRYDDDVLSNFLKKKKDPEISDDDLLARLKSLFHVEICDGSDNALKTKPEIDGPTVYYANFVYDLPTHQHHAETQNLDLKVAIGNTGTEAMAAMLASSPENSAKKTIVEEQLESVNLFSKLGSLIGDIGPKFQEARHTSGFNRISGGLMWKLTAKPTEDQKGEAISVSDEILTALNDLNTAQHEYDVCLSELESLKEQLYMDWCKYMKLAYPLHDEIDNELLEKTGEYLETIAIPEVKQKIESCGFVSIKKSDLDSGGQDTMDLGDDAHASLANTVREKWKKLYDLLSNHTPEYLLSSTSANYYWQPKPPVILLSGLTEDGSEATILKKAGDNNKKVYVGDCKCAPNTVPKDLIPPPNSNQNLSEQKTNPFILEWGIELTDTALDRYDNQDIHADALIHCVQIQELGPDFEKTPNFKTGELSAFSGSVIMGNNARREMVQNLIEFIKSEDKTYFPGKKQDSTEFHTTDELNVFKSKLQSLIDKFTDKNEVHLQVLLELKELLEHNILSQTLSGFNHACIMQGMTAQLPVLDPMGFPGTTNTPSLTQQVADLTKDIKRLSPLMGFWFNPIRSGTIELNDLNLIDNFGQVSAVNIPEDIFWAETLKDNKDQPFLHPRLTQPARLHFDWLDASNNPANVNKEFSQLKKSNNLPQSSPICGWLVPNYLDNDLMVFGSDGGALGYINQDAEWCKPPYAKETPNLESDISNEHLRRIVNWLVKKPTLLAAFLDSVQSAQDNISPSHASVFKSQAILMGQPIAVARVALHFDIMGLPVIDQSWKALLRDISNKATYQNRDNDNWTNVEIPFRLGEHQQLDDGLIGYWMENNAAKFDNEIFGPLMAPESTNSNPLINTFVNNRKLQESISIKETKIATLLLDPRSGVHCTCGILPAIKNSIDSSLFLPAMQRLEMWFQMSAILQPTETLEKDAVLNLPAIEGKEWHWYDKFNPVDKSERNIVKDETDGFHLTSNTLTESFLTLKNKN